jgi:hypothetical protein
VTVIDAAKGAAVERDRDGENATQVKERGASAPRFTLNSNFEL